MTSRPDVCYVVREGDDNEELRYSLRSLRNLPHGQVFIAGYKPSWVQNVVHLPVAQGNFKHANSGGNLLVACRDKRLSDDFGLMNDDFFIMSPIGRVPNLRRLKPMKHYLEMYENLNSESHFLLTMKRATEVLEFYGIKKLDNYDLHMPMMINKTRFLALYDKVQVDFPGYGLPHRRSLYGNYLQLGGQRVRDAKVLNDQIDFRLVKPFLSTIARSFADGEVGRYIRDSFPEKSGYEK